MKHSPQVFIGIDGGGSHTRALAVDTRGRSLSSITVSGCNPHNLGFQVAGDRINEAVSQLLDSLDSKAAKANSIFCGIAGIRNAEERSSLAKSLSRFQWANDSILQINHDLSIAFEAALGDQPGICLIAGTGASCIAKNARGEFHTASNRLPNGNEPGSGYGVGMDAVNAGIARIDSESRDAISNLANSVIQLSHEGNLLARKIVDANASAIIQLVNKVHTQAKLSENFPIVLTGGMGAADTLYRTLMLEKLSALFPNAEIRHPRMTPVEAAAQFALRNSMNSL